MKSSMARTSDASIWPPARAGDESPAAKSRGEQGRRAVLAGWVITMLGIGTYILALSRAGESADILDALFGQGPLGWVAGALMLTGVVTWFIGNYVCLQDLAQLPGDDEE